MIEFKESKFYKLLQDFFINNDKETFIQFLAEFYNKTEGIIDKNIIQDDLIKELRDLYIEFNEKGIDENIVIEKVNYFVENNVKIKDIIVKLITNTNNIKNITSQLEHNEIKQGDFINLKNYCVGDGVTDDTTNFFKALEYAKLNKLAVLVDGKFLIKRKIIIENNTIPKIYGVNKNISKIIFDMATIQDEALKVETNYITSLIIEDVGFETNTPVIKNFLNLNTGGWGSQIKMFNCSIDGFGGNILELNESFQCIFDNCSISVVSINNVTEGVLLKINKGNTFSNQNTFYNCLFANGKIGVQNLGGIKYVFDSCTFTGLTLFMNCPLLPGLDQLQDFKNCWFESITKGILNCEIDNSLNPINIDTTKSDLKNMQFNNNQIADTPAMTFDERVEPVLAPKSQYYLMNGWNIKVNNLEVFEKVSILSGEWDGEIKIKKTSYGIVTIKGSISPKTNTPTQLGVICNIGDKKPDNNYGFLATDSPNGGVSAKFLLGSNGNLMVPFGETYNSAFTYNFYFSYQI